MKIEDFGTVTFDGIELKLTQLPYLTAVLRCGYGTMDCYIASAIDPKTDKLYEIMWPIINPDCDDESDACDWTKYKVKKLF